MGGGRYTLFELPTCSSPGTPFVLVAAPFSAAAAGAQGRQRDCRRTTAMMSTHSRSMGSWGTQARFGVSSGPSTVEPLSSERETERVNVVSRSSRRRIMPWRESTAGTVDDSLVPGELLCLMVTPLKQCAHAVELDEVLAGCELGLRLDGCIHESQLWPGERREHMVFGPEAERQDVAARYEGEKQVPFGDYAPDGGVEEEVVVKEKEANTNHVAQPNIWIVPLSRVICLDMLVPTSTYSPHCTVGRERRYHNHEKDICRTACLLLERDPIPLSFPPSPTHLDHIGLENFAALLMCHEFVHTSRHYLVSLPVLLANGMQLILAYTRAGMQEHSAAHAHGRTVQN
ncbi:hypothetical protein DFH09DRAFT_1090250 [Mycena vulgaris]|nr:hypothetical protein DFH09DRAFT_1090250 [Mycena vulgaris]